ncbi:MAG: KH domain-containing protein [Candidatus Pacebacteria bacterium]|nr:KH domain-containing protein [Candidatus Paceibacterota bacterium]
MSNVSDQEFVEFVVKSIVDHPDEVNIERTVDEMGVLISLKINPEDMGQVIGRQGSTAKSIRNLLRVIGAKNNARVNFKIVEPEGSLRGESRVTKNVDDVVGDLSL